MSSTPITTRISDYYNPFTDVRQEGNGDSWGPHVSLNGKLVAFTSLANNLGTDYARFSSQPDIDNKSDVYLHIVDSGVNTLLSFDGWLALGDVWLPGGLRYTPTNDGGAVSPQVVFQPSTGAYGMQAVFVTDSAGVVPGTFTPVVSDGSRDIALVSFSYFDSTEPWGDFVSVSHIDVIEEGARVVGTPVYSGNGHILAYVAADGYEVRTLDRQPNRGASDLRVSADAPIQHVSLSYDGNLLAFDTAAQFIDINGDGTSDLGRPEPDAASNVFVLDLGAGTLRKVTPDPITPALASHPGGFVGAFLPDASGGAPQLVVTSDVDPATWLPYAQSQALLYTLANGAWQGERLSIDAVGGPVTSGQGALATSAAAPLGTSWAGFLSDASDLAGAPPGPGAAPYPVLGWAGGVGELPVLLTPADPASGRATLDADVHGLTLAAVPYAPDDASFLETQPAGSVFTLSAYSTEASNLLGTVAGMPGVEHVYLSTFRAPATLLPPDLRVLDYSLGSALNPMLPDGTPSVDSVAIDVPGNAIVESRWVGNGVDTNTSVTARLGGAYLPGDDFRVLLDQSASVSLGAGDDTVLSTRLWFTEGDGRPHVQFDETTLDGGPGFDAIEVQAGSLLSFALPGPFVSGVDVRNFEALRFDPASAAGQRNDMGVSFAAGTALPFTHLVGSPGVDVLTLAPYVPNGAYTLDLRGLILVGFGDTPPLVIGDTQYNEWIRVDFDVDPAATGLNALYGPAGARLVADVARSADMLLVGGDQDDWFNLPDPGPGAHRVDGAGGYDVAFLRGSSTDHDYVAGGSVHGQAVDFRLLDKRLPDAADGFANVELLGFNDGYFTPAQLAARSAQPPVVNLVLLGGQGTAAEGTPPQPGGVVQATLLRSGDLGAATTVSWQLVTDTARSSLPASADDLGLPFGQVYTSTFLPGQGQVFIDVPLVADSVHEADESFLIELTGVVQGSLGSETRQRLIIVNDDGFDFALDGAAASAEAAPYVLTILPNSQFAYFGADGYHIDWGDGSARQVVTPAQLQAGSGQVLHSFADGAPAPGTAASVVVTAIDVFGSSVARGKGVAVIDLPPTLDATGAESVEHGAPYVLQLGTYADPGQDALQGLRIDWGDGSQSVAAVDGSSLSHGFDTLGGYTIQVHARNDDGEFGVDTQPVRVTASAGQATPNGTPAQWAAAWTDNLMRFSHKANIDSASEVWSPVTLSAVFSSVLAGGDLYGGLLGVSGRSANTSSVRQEIDGSEALRIELTGGNRADVLVVDLARLFTDDAPGLNEAGRVQFFDGSTLVTERALLAEQADGRLHVEFIGLPEFTSVVFTAGAFDENAGGVFRPGGMVDGQGGYIAAPAGVGSDYLVAAVQFMNLPDVPLTGVATDFGG